MQYAQNIKKFSDLPQKLRDATQMIGSYGAGIGLGNIEIGHMVNNAHRSIVNAHGRFYGLRSKYDGNGNKRIPIKA